MDHEKDLELLRQSFPHVSCYCELCDCGRHRHHKNCRKLKKTSTPTLYTPKTDYQATYKAYENAKPRSSKRPRPVRRFTPPPLEGTTCQKDEFKIIDVAKHCRPSAYYQVMEYEKPTIPFSHKSYYQAEFKPKPMDTVSRVEPKPGKFKMSDGGKFHTMTTNREFFQNWSQPSVNVSFTEPPSFMGSVLFPSNKQEEVQSVTRRSFPGTTAKKTKPAKVPEGNLHIGEGEHDLLTVNRDVYRGHAGTRSQIVVHKHQLGKENRLSFCGETQNNRDFKNYEPNAGRRRPASPPQATIDLQFDDSRQMYETEQRKIYQGHDTRIHQAPKPSRRDVSDYIAPTVSFETKTSNKVDYGPKCLNEASQNRAAMPRSKWDVGGKFCGETTNKHYYQNWQECRGPQRRGDFLDGLSNLYLPPVQPFLATTTHHDAFQPITTERRPIMKPKQEPIALCGVHDFETINRTTYKGERLPLCKAEAFLLQQELKRRLQAEGIESTVLAQSVQPKLAVCAK